MEPTPDHPLKPQLEKAAETLAQALEEACEADIEVNKLDTGELIRIEEILSIAGDAARRAVSLKRRLHGEESDDAQEGGSADDVGPPADEDTAAAEVVHRLFEDAGGRRWDAFAVHPTEDVASRARLPEPYRGGWLAFDCGEEKRRLSPIPDDWASRTVDGLRELLASAQPAPNRVPQGERRAEP